MYEQEGESRNYRHRRHRGGAFLRWTRASVSALLLLLPSCALLPKLPERPEELTEPGTRIGMGWLVREVVAADSRLGTVGDFVALENTGELIVVASGGTLKVTHDDTTAVHVPFSGRIGKVQVIDPEHNDLRYIDRGGGWQAVSVIKTDGTAAWTYKPWQGPNSLAAGDFESDGALDFVVGLNGSGGVRRLDENGVEVWQQPDGNVWQVEIVDIDGDDTPEILHSNASGELTIRDPDGDVRAKEDFGCYFSHFAVVKLPGGHHAALCASDGGLVELRELGGERTSMLSAPDSDGSMEIEASLVGFDPDRPHLAVLLKSGWNWNRSILYVYDEQSEELLYQEVLASDCHALSSAPGENEKQTLLVGCDDEVYRYSQKTN